MIDMSIVWKVSLLSPDTMVPRILPVVFFSKSRAIAYALDKKKLFNATDYILEALTIGDNDPAMEAMLAIRKALKALEDEDEN